MVAPRVSMKDGVHILRRFVRKTKRSRRIHFLPICHTMKKSSLLYCFYFVLYVIAIGSAHDEEQTFALIGVSGTLQDGFELRNRLDYSACAEETRASCDDDDETTIPAKFVGKALVRGYKAYLDIKPKGWRE